MKKLDKLLDQIYNRNTERKGIGFLCSIIKDFGDIIGKDHILVSLVNADNLKEAEAIIVYSLGELQPSLNFKLKNTPCADLTEGKVVRYNRDVQQLFPKDLFLSKMKANSFFGNPLRSSDGKLLGMITVMDSKPVSEAEAEEIKILLQVMSVHAEQSLEGEFISNQRKGLEQRYRKLFENARAAIFLMDPYNFFDCNPYTLTMFECDMDSIVGKSPADFSPLRQADGSLSSEKAVSLLNAALEGELKTFEWIHLTKTGREFFAEVKLSRIDLGSKTFIQAIVHDITDIKKSALAIQEERDFAEMIIDSLPVKFSLYDITGGIRNVSIVKSNKHWNNLGYTREELNSPRNSLFLYSPGQTETMRTVEHELSHNKSYDFEINLLHKDGYEIPHFFRVNIFEKDNRTYLMGFGIDISEKKQAESALQISEQKFKNIFNSISDGIIVMDLQYRILNANHTVLKIFNYKFEDIAFENVFRFVPEQYHCILKSRTELLIKNEHLSPFEIEAFKSTGESITVEISSIVTRYGNSEGILTIVRDISERKLYEKRLFNSEIYAEEKERERLARELHDGLGPILSTCKIYMYSLCEKMEGDKDMLNISKRSLKLLDDALGTIKEVANNLSPHILHNFGFVQALLSFTTYLESISKIRFEVIYDFEKRLNEVIEITVYRILTELINNTLKYAEATQVKIEIELDEPELKVRYKDNGNGFDLEEIKKKNKGFGIVNIENRISKLNGKFSYSTSPGKGVKVEFRLNLL